MREIRRYYRGEQLSATKLNELVDALRCLCSEAKRLQKTRFTYGAQPINAERRYWAHTSKDEDEETELWEECVCIGSQCIATCRAAFEVVKWGATEYTYLTPGAMWNGIDLDQMRWSRVSSTQRPLYIKDGGFYTRQEAEEYYGRDRRTITSWGVRDGVLMMKDNAPTHRGGGAYRRVGVKGYGAVYVNNVTKVYVSNLPYHIMSGGVDSWVGGRMSNGIESSNNYNLCNAIKIYNGAIESGIPDWTCVCQGGGVIEASVETYPILFLKGTQAGLTATGGEWLKVRDGELGGAIPCYNKSGVRFWFCMSVNSTYLKEMGYAEVKWNGRTGNCGYTSWQAAVPVAYAFRNVYSGYVECARILEDEVMLQPTVYITAPGGTVVLCGAGMPAMLPLSEGEELLDDGYSGGATTTSCIKEALWVSLPKTISKQRFFPWGNVCEGFHMWEGCCEGEEPEEE